MIKACTNNGKLLEEILKREDISQLTAAERSHIEQCPNCKKELGKILMVENRLKAYVSTSLASIPMRKFRLPVTEKPLPQTSPLKSIIQTLKSWQFATGFAVIFIACSYLFFAGIKGSERMIPERTPDITLSSQQPDTIKETDNGFLIVKSLQKFSFDGYSIETEDAVIKLQDHAARLKCGHILCSVTPGTSLTIFTPTATIRALGTKFEVAVYKNDETYVNVIDGRVEVIQSNNRETLTLEASQFAVVSSPPVDFPSHTPPVFDSKDEHCHNDSDDGFEKPSAKTLGDLLE